MAYTYILECADGSFYVGSTTSLEHRLYQHQLGEGSAYTRRRLPIRLLWSHEFETIPEAFAFEKQVQNWGRAKRLALIEGRLNDLPALARGRCRPPPRRGLDDDHPMAGWSSSEERASSRPPPEPSAVHLQHL